MKRNASQAFEELYRRDGDPWSFATSAYELNKYRETLQALSRSAYQTAFEPGCSIGELTSRLAAVCSRVIATDFSPTAVARARERCAGLDNVEISCADLADSIPAGPLDLIVFSEILYYFEEPRMVQIAQEAAARLTAGGELIAVHWLGQSADHALHGDQVHDLLRLCLPLRWTSGARHEGFRIDCWMKS